MKNIIVLIAIMLSLNIATLAKEKELKEVSYDLCFHCNSCVAKVEQNVPFFKGVKDLKIDKKSGKVTISYDEAKTSADKIKTLLTKLKVEFKAE